MAAAAKRKADQPSAEALAAIRQQLEEHRERLEWLRNAPIPSQDAKARIREELDALTPDIPLGMIAHHADGDRIDTYLTARPNGMQYDSGAVSVLPPLLLLLRPQIEQALIEHIDAAKNVEAGPPLADRPKLIRETEDRLAELEVEEEEVTSACELAGIAVQRNPHARIEVVVGAREDTDGTLIFDEAKVRRLISAASAARAQYDHAVEEFRAAQLKWQQAKGNVDRLLSSNLRRLPEHEREAEPALKRARKALADAEAVRDDWARAREEIGDASIGIRQIARRAEDWATATRPGVLSYGP